jgi:hypothetical protein
MKDQRMYEYLRQHAKLPMLKIHSFLEIEESFDKVTGLAERVSIRRETDMLFEQRFGQNATSRA